MDQKVIVLAKPYSFEGVEHTEIDLRGLEDLRTKDIVDADRLFGLSGQMAVMNENQTGYCMILASKATKKPVEFFNELPVSAGLEVKQVVMNFLS